MMRGSDFWRAWTDLLDLAHAIAADTGPGDAAGLVERSTAKGNVPY